MRARTISLVGAAVLLLALAARLSRLFVLFQGGEVVALDGDSLRHLMRMEQAARDGLRVPAFDPWVNWPHGAFEPWAPGFDLVGALLMWPFADATTARLAASTLPVLLALATLVLVVKAGARLSLSPLASWGAALVVAFAPQLVASSYLGRTDHHVWERCSLVALGWWALTPSLERGWRFEFLGGALVFFALWGFDGAPLYVALVTACLALTVLLEPSPRLVGSGAAALALGGVAAALAYAPVMVQHGAWFTFKRPSLLQPALVALAAVGVVLAVLATRGRGHRWLKLPALLAGLIGLALLVPPLREQVLAGLEEWLARKDPWLASVAEFQPMLGPPDGVSRLRHSFGLWAWTLPVLLPLGLRALWRTSRAAGLAWGVLTAGTFALTLLQMRFGRVAIPFVVVTCVAALVELSQRWRSPRAAWLAPALCVVAVAVDPKTYDALTPTEQGGQKPIVELSQALRSLAPEHGGLGVLANWEDGHFIEALGRHPVLVNGFGSYASPEGYEVSRTFWQGTEETMEALFRDRQLGWWIDGAQNFLGRKVGDRALFVERDGKPVLEGKTVREWPLAASLFGGSGDVRRRVPHLAHFWPRAASTSATVDVGVKLPDLWLFEHVEGVVVEGRATPGSVVSASLVLDERWPYTAWTVAGADGGYALRLPVPSGFEGPGLRTAPSWTLTVDGVATALQVGESAVRSGARLPR